MKTPKQNPFEEARRVFAKRGGTLRTGDALAAGIHPETLYALRDAGVLERLHRGLYRLADMPPLGQPDLVTVSMKIPNGVICLISALSFHEITSEIPHEVYYALPRGAKRPRLEYPPARIFWFIPSVFEEGIETHTVDGVRLRVYSIEKTIADCFKYRNKIGLDTAIEALKRYQERGHPDVGSLMRFARVCRVEKVMRPYLEALL